MIVKLLAKYKKKMPAPYNKANTIQELLAMEGGEQVWADKGGWSNLTFDLSENSKSNFILQKYLERKKKEAANKSKEQPKQFAKKKNNVDQVDEPDLSDLDQSILDKMWRDPKFRKELNKKFPLKKASKTKKK